MEYYSLFSANSDRRFDNLCGSLHTRNTNSDHDFYSLNVRAEAYSLHDKGCEQSPTAQVVTTSFSVTIILVLFTYEEIPCKRTTRPLFPTEQNAIVHKCV